jgi:eukaryotic-like serine/threonine-protein kinase
MLGRMYGNIGESAISADYSRKAYELRDRTSEAEKYLITASFYIAVTGDMEKAEQSCELWLQSYPRTEIAHSFLAGIILLPLGKYDKAVEEGKEAVQSNPDFPVSYEVLMSDEMALDLLDEAEATYKQAVQRKLDSGSFLHISPYQMGFLQNDAAEMAKQVGWSVGKPGIGDELLGLEADTAAYSGRLKEAQEFSRQALDSALREKEREAAATYSVLSGLREALFGNAERARRDVKLAMNLSAGRDVQYGAALALSYGGENTRAKTLTEGLSKRFPDDTLVRFNYLPTLQAKFALSRGNASEALESLRATTPYELGVTTSSPNGWTAMYPVYVHGEAYLAAHQPSEAAAEFQKIIDHRGLVVNEPIGALAHLEIGRAYAMSGDSTRAKAPYKDFLTLWKDADADIPILKQAKAEYAKLK